MALLKNFVFLTAAERTRLASALNAVESSGFIANLASQHSNNFNSGIHWGSAFLPWHRWFLGVLEQELQSHQPGVMIPFWDWTRPDSRSIDVEPWKSFFGGRSNTGGQFDHWTYFRASSDNGHHLPELLPGGMGDAIVPRLASTTFAQFRAIESAGGHGGGHNWVGGTMGGGGSPLDPLFWLHHCNIDRLWAIWQRNHPAPATAQYTLDPAPPGDRVPAAMVPAGSAMIGGATPNSMLDHLALGDSYDVDVRLAGAWESTGRPLLVTGDPTQVDLYIRDNTTDTGDTPSTVPHWESPDIWVRNEPPGPTENPDDGHQSPIVNQPNHVYVRVHNRGAATTDPLAVEAYRCLPGTGMLWPTHFQSLGSMPLPGVAGGAAERVGPFVWSPTVAGHECLLAIGRTETQDPGSLETAHGVTVPAGTAAPLDHSLLVRFDNNVGQRNVAPVLAAPGAHIKLGLTIRGLTTSGTHSITIDAAQLPPDTVVSARLANGTLDTGHSDMAVIGRDDRFTTLAMDGGAKRSIDDVVISANGSFVLTMSVNFSFQARHLKRYPVRVEQAHEGAVIGAYTIELTAVKDLDDYFFGNPRSGELHVNACPLWPRINKVRLHTFEHVDDALARGYNGCRFCLPQHDSG